MVKFDPSFFAANRRQLKQAAEHKLIVVAANNRMQFGPDVAFPFRQDSYFWYLTGINLPGAVLVMTPDSDFVIAPYQERFDIISDGKIDTDKLIKTADLDTAYSYRAGWQILKQLIADHKNVGVLGTKQRLERYTTANSGRSTLNKKLRRIAKNTELHDIRPILVRQRMIKQEPEISAIQAAVNIACQAFKSLRSEIQNMRFEYEVEAFLAARFRSSGASQSFVPVVVSGKNAHAIHLSDNDQPLEKDQLLVIDMGAEVSHYASDITRTYALGKPNQRQKEVIEAVADVQRYAYSLIKPGVDRREYELAVEAYMGKTLLKLGLITKSERKQIRRYFTHATSHHMGLDVHDVADYTKPFAENMVLTVEPGIYIPEEGIGVRIEDDVLVTKNGIRIMSQDLPPVMN